MDRMLFPGIVAADEEVWDDPGYRWDNSKRPPHDCCVVQRTVSGRVQFEEKRKIAYAGPGQALLFTHREATAYGYPSGDTESYQLQFIAFFPGALRPFFDALRSEFGSIVAMHEKSESARALNELVQLQRKRHFRDHLHATELISRLLLFLHREQISARQIEDPVDYGYRLLNDSATIPRGLKDIAELAGISREHFVREYSRRYGRTPGAVLRELRLERARSLLLATSHSLADIAAACGFGSADALRRSFEQHFGQKPSALRSH